MAGRGARRSGDTFTQLPQELDVLRDGSGEDDQVRRADVSDRVRCAIDRGAPQRVREHGRMIDAEGGIHTSCIDEWSRKK